MVIASLLYIPRHRIASLNCQAIESIMSQPNMDVLKLGFSGMEALNLASEHC